MRLKSNVSVFLSKHNIFGGRFFRRLWGFWKLSILSSKKKLSQKIYSDSEQFQELKKLID